MSSNKVGIPTSEENAQRLMDRFFETYPKLKRWYQKERANARAGQDRTRTLAGRLRLLDLKYRYGGWRVSPPATPEHPHPG